MRWLIGILINAVLFIAFAGYFEGFHVSSFGAAVVASLVLSILNILVRPLLILLTLPITLLTLGLFLLVINAITLSMTDAIMGSKFEIDGFGFTILIAVIMAIINMIIQKTILDSDRSK
ncbi:integral inner membrane protein [Bacillus freudenreichii]|nr:integral inner membrane protein [Bacillus freudenreichii]